ncbi:MAG: hypothetical protein QNI96_13835 [Woeseiaceae bacterium]|nr:hypothetical protein [Woeseiaceae bacterium]
MHSFRILVVLAGVALGPAALAAEISHTAYTWFCVDEGRAHGMCTSRHSDCGLDCTSLKVACSVDRAGRLMAKKTETIRDVGKSGTFKSVIHVPLYGTGTIRYCTRNKSKYVNWLGTAFFGQGTSTDCREYSRSASQGGEEN